MDSADSVMRRALWATAVFNVVGAVAFAFPAAPVGQLAGLPPVVPVVYRAMMALFVLLFGGTYAWLAGQPAIDRPLVAFCAIGKASVFFVILVLWLACEIAGRSVMLFGGDLAFATLFAWWLAVSGAPAAREVGTSRKRA